MGMRVTSYDRNRGLESSPEADSATRRALARAFPDAVGVTPVSEPSLQRRGVDWIVASPSRGFIAVDTKIRDGGMLRAIWDRQGYRDLLAEVDQSGTGVGWATDPTYLTHVIMQIAVGDTGSWDPVIAVRHDMIRRMLTTDIDWTRSQFGVTDHVGWNGYTKSFCVSIPEDVLRTYHATIFKSRSQ